MTADRLELVAEAFGHLDADTRARVLDMARRPDTVDDTASVAVRIQAAFHPDTPTGVRVELSSDPSPGVRCSAVEAGLPPAAQRAWAAAEELEGLHRACEHLDDPAARRVVALRLARDGDLEDGTRAERLARLTAQKPLEVDSARELAAACGPDTGADVADQVARILVQALLGRPDLPADDVLAVAPDHVAVAVAASSELNVSEAAREAAARRLVVEPLTAAAPQVPEEVHEVIYRFDPLPPAAHAEVARLVASADLSGCTRAAYLRKRFVNTPEVRAANCELARSTGDPAVLARLLDDAIDKDAQLAAAVLANPVATSEVAVAAAAHLSVSDVPDALRARPDDVKFFVALTRRWPGALEALDATVRGRVADQLLAELTDGPLDRHATDRVRSIAAHASPAGLAALPCASAQKVLPFCPEAAAWFAGRVSQLSPAALEVLCALTPDASGTLGALLDAAEASVATPLPA